MKENIPNALWNFSENKLYIFGLQFLRLSPTSTHASVQHVTFTQGLFLFSLQNFSVQQKFVCSTRQFSTNPSLKHHTCTPKNLMTNRRICVELTGFCSTDGFWGLKRSEHCVEVTCLTDGCVEVMGTPFLPF